MFRINLLLCWRSSLRGILEMRSKIGGHCEDRRSIVSGLCHGNGWQFPWHSRIVHSWRIWSSTKVCLSSNSRPRRLLTKNSFAYSSLSVVLNSTAGVLLEDICKGCFKTRPSEKRAALIVKGSILILGCLAMVFLFVVEKLGGILEVIWS